MIAKRLGEASRKSGHGVIIAKTSREGRARDEGRAKKARMRDNGGMTPSTRNPDEKTLIVEALDLLGVRSIDPGWLKERMQAGRKLAKDLRVGAPRTRRGQRLLDLWKKAKEGDDAGAMNLLQSEPELAGDWIVEEFSEGSDSGWAIQRITPVIVKLSQEGCMRAAMMAMEMGADPSERARGISAWSISALDAALMGRGDRFHRAKRHQGEESFEAARSEWVQRLLESPDPTVSASTLSARMMAATGDEPIQASAMIRMMESGARAEAIPEPMRAPLESLAKERSATQLRFPSGGSDWEMSMLELALMNPWVEADQIELLERIIERLDPDWMDRSELEEALMIRSHRVGAEDELGGWARARAEKARLESIGARSRQSEGSCVLPRGARL